MKKPLPAPFCHFCGDKPARSLRIARHSSGPLPAVYCSVHCAAAAAFNDVLENGIYWCKACWDWHSDSAGCMRTTRNGAEGKAGGGT